MDSDPDGSVPALLRWPSGPVCVAGPRRPPAAERVLARRAVELLDVGFEDRVLEIGFGTGTGLALARARGAQMVAGVDPSEAMVQAAHRSLGQLAVELRVGAAASLPWADAFFTRALAVNGLHLWDWPLDGLREVRRVLAPGGRLVLGLRTAPAGTVRPSPPEMPLESVGVLIRMMPSAGFRSVGVERQDSGEPFVYLVAHA